ncbi:MAG: HAMP domain-containing histidine kinase, partial [Clostridia bacterium]|nr:HAMP domain-containing histidine kinase [Clostridia bacterium]
IVLFFAINLSNYEISLKGDFIIVLMIFVIILFIYIQKAIKLYYKQKMLIQDLEETKKELAEKKKEIEELEKEILDFSKTSHSIAHKQKALEFKLKELTKERMLLEENDIKNQIEEITKELQNKKLKVELTKTEIKSVDDMLKYMQYECIENKIDFQLQITGNVHHIINKYIKEEDLIILLADHIKNAIIAINHSKNNNRSILVKLGKINNEYALYIYDTGIEFEDETLLNIGKKPSTTHKEEGGTGMGFMNTFDTLNKSKISFVIKEIGKPSESEFTKVLIFKFDNKNEFNIETYKNK